MRLHARAMSNWGEAWSDAHWRVKRRITRRRDIREAERIHREMDAEENEQVALPEGERVYWPCMWLTELYAPSHASSLVKAVELFEAGSSSIFLHAGRRSGWVERARTWTGGHSNLGDFRHVTRFPFMRQRVKLPRAFTSMHAELAHVAPGITVLSMQFVLAGEEQESLDRIMRSSYETRVTPLKDRPGGQEVRGPEHRKQDEVEAARYKIRSVAREWVADVAPGLFSDLKASRPPAWDLLLTRKSPLNAVSPFDKRWREVLGLGNCMDEWQPDQLDALRLVRPFDHRIGNRSEVVPSLIGIEGDAFKMLEGQHMGEGVSGLAALADRHLVDHLSLWTLLIALEAHESQFAGIRDELAAPTRWWSAGKKLRRLRSEVMPMSFDLRSLGDASQNERALNPWSRRTGTEYKLIPGRHRPREGAPERSLRGFLQELVQESGSRIARRGQDVAEGLRVQGEILLAMSNARVQWLVVGLTLVVGVAGIIVTAQA